MDCTSLLRYTWVVLDCCYFLLFVPHYIELSLYKHYIIKWVILSCNLQLSYIFCYGKMSLFLLTKQKGLQQYTITHHFLQLLGSIKVTVGYIFWREKLSYILFSLAQWDLFLFSFLAATITFIAGFLSSNKISPSSRIQCSNGQNFVVSL